VAAQSLDFVEMLSAWSATYWKVVLRVSGQ